MKHMMPVLGIVANVLLIWTTVSWAGVVLSQTAITSSPLGRTAQQREIFVQGNKQKIETSGAQIITDLDKRSVYFVDKVEKDYIQLPLQAFRTSNPDQGQEQTNILLKRTGKKRKVAHHTCDEFRGARVTHEIHISVDACVSQSVPGAKEVAGFERKMAAEVEAHGSRKQVKDTPIVALERQSIVKLRVPNPSGHGYRTASIERKTKINRIKVAKLPAGTFTPPKGFAKLNGKGNEPTETLPDENRLRLQAQSQMPAPDA